MDNLIKIRSDKQISNDKRLSDFFKNYHCKIKELKQTEDNYIDKKMLLKKKTEREDPRRYATRLLSLKK